MAQNSLRILDRRGLLLFGAAAGAVWGGGAVMRRIADTRLQYRPDPRVDGFRRIDGGVVSSGATDPFVGIGGTPKREETPAPGEICAWLYPGPQKPGVPVAYFWDYACPHCRPLSRALIAMDAEGLIALNWHHTPVFGPRSDRVARFAVAAGIQGGTAKVMARLSEGRLQPSPSGLAAMADALGLDVGRLAATLDDEAVTRSLARSRGLSRAFAFPGTPSLVIGRTVAVGALSETRLRAVIAAETDEIALCGQKSF